MSVIISPKRGGNVYIGSDDRVLDDRNLGITANGARLCYRYEGKLTWITCSDEIVRHGNNKSHIIRPNTDSDNISHMLSNVCDLGCDKRRIMMYTRSNEEIVLEVWGRKYTLIDIRQGLPCGASYKLVQEFTRLVSNGDYVTGYCKDSPLYWIGRDVYVRNQLVYTHHEHITSATCRFIPDMLVLYVLTDIDMYLAWAYTNGTGTHRVDKVEGEWHDVPLASYAHDYAPTIDNKLKAITSCMTHTVYAKPRPTQPKGRKVYQYYEHKIGGLLFKRRRGFYRLDGCEVKADRLIKIKGAGRRVKGM